MNVEPLRLAISVLTLICLGVMIPATLIIFRFADTLTRYRAVVKGIWLLVWLNLCGWGYVTVTRVGRDAPITDATIINLTIVVITLCVASAIVTYDLRHTSYLMPQTQGALSAQEG